MISLEEKQAVLATLRTRLKAEHETLVAAQKATQAGATHEEAKPENDKDTRALEQSYLARGQAERVIQLTSDLQILGQLRVRSFAEDALVGLSAIVQLEDEDGEPHLYLLVPSGAGEELSCSIGQLKVVTPQSPLGRALMGARVGDDVELRSPKAKRVLSVVAIA